MRLVDERVEKQKTRCFARTSRQRRSQSRNRSRIPRRDIAAREDRTFLFHVRATFLQHEDYRGRSEYAAEQGSRRERSVEKGNKRKVPRIDGEGQRGLRGGLALGLERLAQKHAASSARSGAQRITVTKFVAD